MFCPTCGTQSLEGANYCLKCGASLSGLVVGAEPVPAVVPPVAAVASTPTRIEYAGFWIRVIASLVDSVIMQVVGGGIVAVVLGGTIEAHGMSAVAGGLGVIFSWLYHTLSESSGWQATLGKRLLSLRVVDANGMRIDFGTANVRYWSKILSAMILLIGFVMVGLTERKQGLHDKIAGTFVLRVRP